MKIKQFSDVFSEQAVSNTLQDTMVMLSKLEPQMQEFISEIIRVAYTQARRKEIHNK